MPIDCHVPIATGVSQENLYEIDRLAPKAAREAGQSDATIVFWH